MLALRPNCECCDRDLPPESDEALICTFECTWCLDCAEGVLGMRCPNCGGNLVSRPIRPAHLLEKYPASEKRVLSSLSACKEVRARGGRLEGSGTLRCGQSSLNADLMPSTTN